MFVVLKTFSVTKSAYPCVHVFAVCVCCCFGLTAWRRRCGSNPDAAPPSPALPTAPKHPNLSASHQHFHMMLHGYAKRHCVLSDLLSFGLTGSVSLLLSRLYVFMYECVCVHVQYIAMRYLKI